TQNRPAIARSPGGGFVVAWTGYGSQDGSSSGIFAQRLVPTFTIVSPLPGDTPRCHAPIFTGPTFKRTAPGYDVFPALRSPPPGLLRGAVVTSGTTLLKTTSYNVPVKKWSSACQKALAADPNNPTLFLEVFGVDKQLPKSDLNRKKFTPSIQVKV